MLLHDEHARADSPDRELLVALRAAPRCASTRPPEPRGGPWARNSSSRSMRVGGALGVHGDSAVGFVANPSPQAERERLALRWRHGSPRPGPSRRMAQPHRPCRCSRAGPASRHREVLSRPRCRRAVSQGFLGELAVSSSVQDAVSCRIEAGRSAAGNAETPDKEPRNATKDWGLKDAHGGRCFSAPGALGTGQRNRGTRERCDEHLRRKAARSRRRCDVRRGPTGGGRTRAPTDSRRRPRSDHAGPRSRAGRARMLADDTPERAYRRGRGRAGARQRTRDR